MEKDIKKDIASLAAFKVVQKLLKKIFIAILPVIGSFGFGVFMFLAICYVLIAQEGKSSQGILSFVSFSPEVEAYRDEVVSQCENYGIIEYVNAILAIMQVETGGTTLDPMNAGNKLYNTEYPKKRGSIEDPTYSIEVAVLEIRDLIDLADAAFDDPASMLVVYQAYHFDRGYVDYAADHGGYNTATAKDYLNNSDLPYYLRPGFATNVASFVYIQGGSISAFAYPVDIDDSEITCSFGEETSSGSISTVTYFKTDGSSSIYAITDGDIISATSRSITLKHGKYNIYYKYLNVYDDYLDYDHDGDGTDDGPDITYADKGDALGTSRSRQDLFLQVSYEGQFIDPMSIINLVIDKAYDPDSGNDDVRDAIVDYAKLWMQTPYVWGGTSLYTGVDCSGFMQQIYKNFGYSIPRVSREQANYKGAVWSTTEVYPNVLQKGDLLFYTDESGTVNHVTMYIGDGLIIGAQSRKTGIKITKYNYRTPVKAVRIIE